MKFSDLFFSGVYIKLKYYQDCLDLEMCFHIIVYFYTSIMAHVFLRTKSLAGVSGFGVLDRLVSTAKMFSQGFSVCVVGFELRHSIKKNIFFCCYRQITHTSQNFLISPKNPNIPSPILKARDFARDVVCRDDFHLFLK